MSYKKASDILPSDILERIQEYVEGDYIYIPKRKDSIVKWGTYTNTKKETKQRNQEIFKQYLQGISTTELASIYFLSNKTIQKIVRQIKQMEKE